MTAATPAIPCRVAGRARANAPVVSTLLALLLTGGCAPGHAPAVRPSSTKVEQQIVVTRRPRDVAVEVSEAAFNVAMVHLAAEIHSLSRPLDGWLVLAAWHPQGAEERVLADGFRLWCGLKQSKAARSGCESILEGDGRWLKLESRQAMALSIAMSSVWDGAAEVVKGMVDPAALQAMLYTSLATCMALLLVPEPITKALMVAITVGLCTYLGWSTVWGILEGWRRLQAEASTARTFGELSAAGERFGKLLGANTARVMVMVAAMALGSTAGAAVGGPGASLPAWGQAARLAAAEGLAPALAAPVASVVAVGETLTIGMAAGSTVVMAAGGPGVGGSASEAPPVSPRLETKSLPGRSKLQATEKQLGKKFGEHRDSARPGYRTPEEYRTLAEDILNDPRSQKIVFDANAPRYPGETHYLRGNDLLRLAPDGQFRSLYPVE